LSENDRERTAERDLPKGRRFRLFLTSLLTVAVVAEGYYIYLLQDKIEKRNDELKNISVQLQFLKNERAELKAALSSAQKTGDTVHENTTEK
jgi:hypothetical protein